MALLTNMGLDTPDKPEYDNGGKRDESRITVNIIQTYSLKRFNFYVW